jgi:4-alpha-glucanotransferase
MSERTSLLRRRCAGILCHLTSLPGPGDRGLIGRDAVRFLDFVESAGLHVWQLLPLNPPDDVHSPYHSESAFAIDDGLVDWDAPGRDAQRDARRFAAEDGAAFERFRIEHAYWLEDYALFSVAKRTYPRAWWEWPEALRDHDVAALLRFRHEHESAVEDVIARQFIAYRSWHGLREEAHRRDVIVIGDMPLYPAADSAEVWSHAQLFQLDDQRRMRFVAGVPPDYFSETGQLWGNPVYDWDRMQTTDFAWWVERVRTQLALFDFVRIDHFLGIESYWKVPSGARTAVDGHWCKGPGSALLERLAASFDPLPLIAEDLGTVTPEADALRDAFELPGMRVLQFGFSGDEDNPHEPDAFVPRCIGYTGTHDNDTTLGWYRKLDAKTRRNLHRTLGPEPDMPWDLIRLLFETPAKTAIVPLQDFLGMDSDASMNTPGETHGNSRWRFSWDRIPRDLPARIRALVEEAGRA